MKAKVSFAFKTELSQIPHETGNFKSAANWTDLNIKIVHFHLKITKIDLEIETRGISGGWLIKVKFIVESNITNNNTIKTKRFSCLLKGKDT